MAAESSSGEKRPRPRPFTPARAAARQPAVVLPDALGAALEDQVERGAERGDEADGRREGGVALDLGVGGAAPVEVVARQARVLGPLPGALGDATRTPGRAGT